MRGENLVGIVSRANLLRAVASLAREIPDSTADDDHIRDRIINALGKNDWCSSGRNVIVREGIVHLSGIITDERSSLRAEYRRGEEGLRSSVLDRSDVRNVLIAPEDEAKVLVRHKAISPFVSFRYASGTCPNCDPICFGQKSWCG